MIRDRKQGIILLKNLFFVVAIFIFSVSLLRFQSSNLKTVSSVVTFKNISNNVKLIKNELYFNKQYLHVQDDIYVNEENINTQNYKEFKDIFENSPIINKNYFHLSIDNHRNTVYIEYFFEGKLLLQDIFEL